MSTHWRKSGLCQRPLPTHVPLVHAPASLPSLLISTSPCLTTSSRRARRHEYQASAPPWLSATRLCDPVNEDYPNAAAWMWQLGRHWANSLTPASVTCVAFKSRCSSLRHSLRWISPLSVILVLNNSNPRRRGS